MKYTGVVSRIGSKQFGEKTSYYFFLEGVEGLFKMNGKRPTFKEGAQIEFEANDQRAVNWGTIAPVNSAPPIAHTLPAPEATMVITGGHVPAPSSPAAPVSVEERFDKYRNRAYCDLERRNINRQFAYRLAVELTEKMIAAGAIALTNSKGASLPPDKAYDVYLTHLEELTGRIYADIVQDHLPEIKVADASVEAQIKPLD